MYQIDLSSPVFDFSSSTSSVNSPTVSMSANQMKPYWTQSPSCNRSCDVSFYFPSSASENRVFTFDPTTPSTPSRSPFMTIQPPRVTSTPIISNKDGLSDFHLQPVPQRKSCRLVAASLGESLLSHSRRGQYRQLNLQSSDSPFHNEAIPGRYVGLSESFDDYIYPISPRLDETYSSGYGSCSTLDETDVNPFLRGKENRVISNITKKVFSRPRPHACTHCPKTFSAKSTLKAHIRIHTGEKPYSCAQCSRAFTDYSTWRKHVRLHTGERPYVCDVCGKGFIQSGNMIRHRETHFKSGAVKSTL